MDHSVGTQLLSAVQDRKDSMDAYEKAIARAKAHGWSNTRIALTCGVSEAAIRRYWARHGSEYA